MAARRLLIVLLVLIAVSTVAAALAPRREQQDRTATTATAEPRPAAPAGRSLTRVVDADASPSRIALRVGDALSLVVKSRSADQVSIPKLGLLEPVARHAPARFELVADRPGSFEVRLVNAAHGIATLVVSGPQGD
jgi:hypothetical protein